MFDEPGIFSVAGEIIDVGQAYGVIVKTGNTYMAVVDGKETKLGVGRDSAKKDLYSKPELMQECKDTILAVFKAKAGEGQENYVGTVAPSAGDIGDVEPVE